MAIEITSLFRDILESPEQKQQRQMAEGFARSQNAVSQLTGLATAAAPLVGTMAELQGRRTEALQRGVGGLLGRDVRSTSEKLQQALGQFNPQDPASVSRTAQMLQQMGLGAQAAQLSGMALEEQQRKTAMTEETALRGQQAKLNTAAIARAEQVNTDATQTATDRASFRTQAVQAITASDILNASEKETLRAQVAAGGFDGNAGALYEITSPKPIKIGDQLVQKGANGQWTTVTDTTGPSIRTTLQASANMQYGNNPTALALISDGITNGSITDAKQFKDLAPIPTTETGDPIQPSSQVEEYSRASVEKAGSAAAAVARIDSILTAINAEGGLMDAPEGIFSAIAESAKDTLGLRDSVSFIRTAFTGQLNADIIAALPKGSASDQDVILFSRGYPPANASIAEMAAYLESAKSVMHKVQNFAIVSDKILSEQLTSGAFPTTIGLDEKAAPVLQDIRFIDSRKAYLDGEIASGRKTPEEASFLLNNDLQDFYTDHQFIPSQYR
jgi:hypothetical protein